MTYCVGIKLNSGLVFASDSRTNAGMDQINTFRKMMVYERPGDRFMVLLSAGNLSISQSVREILQVERLQNDGPEATTIWNASSMFDAARVLGRAVRHVYEQDSAALRETGHEFSCSLIFGGQIRGEGLRLFQVYSAGNFIEATAETCYFQIGESKYGKPVLDRLVTPRSSLEDAAKCAIVSMDSTMKSNLSVGPPIDLLVYRNNDLTSDDYICIDEQNPYFAMIRSTWGQKLREAFDSIESPVWRSGSKDGTREMKAPLLVHSERYEELKKITNATEKLI